MEPSITVHGVDKTLPLIVGCLLEDIAFSCEPEMAGFYKVTVAESDYDRLKQIQVENKQ